jgi:hypothetical protein
MTPHNRRESYRANHLKQSVFTHPGPITDIGVTLIKKPRTMPGLESFPLNAAAVVRGCGRSPALWRRRRSSILGSNSVSVKNVRPVVFDAFPNQFADVEWIDTLGYPFAQRFDMLGDWSFRRRVFDSAGEPLREVAP